MEKTKSRYLCFICESEEATKLVPVDGEMSYDKLPDQPKPVCIFAPMCTACANQCLDREPHIPLV